MHLAVCGSSSSDTVWFSLILLGHVIRHVRNERFQTHDAARTGLEGFAVLAVHRAEADVAELRVRADKPGLFRHAEDLLKVQVLPFVGQVHIFLRVIILLTLDDGGKVGRGVERRAV